MNKIQHWQQNIVEYSGFLKMSNSWSRHFHLLVWSPQIHHLIASLRYVETTANSERARGVLAGCPAGLLRESTVSLPEGPGCGLQPCLFTTSILSAQPEVTGDYFWTTLTGGRYETLLPDVSSGSWTWRQRLLANRGRSLPRGVWPCTSAGTL